MPQPPLLPVIDWSKVFTSGVEFEAWLSLAEYPERAGAMREAALQQPLEPAAEALAASLTRTVHVVAIAEDWCGDVVRHVPVLQRLAAASGGKLQVRYIGRAQHLDLFARYLTNGGEAIPQFIFLNDQFVECGHWGPMPESGKRLIARGKGAGNVGAARQKVSALYAADPDKREVVQELCALIETAVCIEP